MPGCKGGDTGTRPNISGVVVWLFFGVCAAFALPAASAEARTWTVSTDGTGETITIQAAIDSAAVSDTVLVTPGTYFEQIVFRGRDIVLKSLAGPSGTIIDGSSSDSSVVVFTSGETNQCVLEGLTITGGQGTIRLNNFSDGGGILCLGSSPTIQNNIIHKNAADWGGGVYVSAYPPNLPDLPQPRLIGNTISENLARRNGGGLYALDSNIEISSNSFLYNSSEFDGGGLSVYLALGHLTMHQNTIIGNVAADKGGGMHVGASPALGGAEVDIALNLIARNEALGRDAGDSGAGGGICVSSSGTLGRLEHNTIAFNTGIGESECGGGGIKLYSTTEDLLIENNIIAFNVHCGISCQLVGPEQSTATWRRNLIWGNGGEPFGSGSGICPPSWSLETIVADPQFCNPALDDYRPSASSPALAMGDPIGAFSSPGCGPTTGQATTWGKLKTLYNGRGQGQ